MQIKQEADPDRALKPIENLIPAESCEDLLQKPQDSQHSNACLDAFFDKQNPETYPPDFWVGQASGVLRVTDLILPGAPPLPSKPGHEDKTDTQEENNPLALSSHFAPLDPHPFQDELSWLGFEDDKPDPPSEE